MTLRGVPFLAAILALGGCGDSMGPVNVDPGLRFLSLSAGNVHSCGLASDGRAFCWGPLAALGYTDQTATGRFALEPFEVETTLRFAQLTSGWDGACGLTVAGAVYCWGRRVVGDGSVNGDSFPHLAPSAVPFASVVQGGDKCALTGSGAAYCWGGGTPAPVPGGVVFARLTVGDVHACGLTASGGALCWGFNTQGQLGIDSVSETCQVGAACNTTPTAVAGGAVFVDLAAGVYHTCGVTIAGGLLCWGGNNDGELGTGDRISRRLPTAVHDSGVYRAVVAGNGYTCALTVTDAARCWGSNRAGLLGVDSLADPTCVRPEGRCNTKPAPVRGGLALRSLSAGWRHVCGLATSGLAYCWGEGIAAQLGDSLKADSPVPVRVSRQRAR